MKIKGVDFVMFQVSDIKKSIDFYQNVLGLKPIGSPGETWAEFQVGNATLSIGAFEKGKLQIGKNSGGIGMAVDDVKASIDELRKKGVKIVDDMYETPMCWGSTISDLDGNKIYLHKRKDGTFGD